MNTLIVYATMYGTTRECAEMLAAKLEGNVDIVEVSKKKQYSGDISGYDGVIIGSSVYTGRVSNGIVAFADKYESELLSKKVGIFLVGMSAGGFEERLKYNFSFELLDVVSVKGFFGGKLDMKPKLFHKLILKMMLAQSGLTELPKKEIKTVNITKFANEFNGHPELNEEINRLEEEERLAAEAAALDGGTPEDVAAGADTTQTDESVDLDAEDISDISAIDGEEQK